MAQIVSAVVTNVWRTKLARIYAGLDSFALPLAFKIAEGGWQIVGPDKEPIPPSVTLTDVTALTYPIGSQFIFTKLLTLADLTFTSPTRCEIRCFVASSEANDDGFGSPPELYELGLFDTTPPANVGAGATMLVYSTFPVEIKTASKALEHVILVDF
jgi:hypothetical protein